MIIGVDCDGVLTDMTAYIFHYGEKWFGRKPRKCNSMNPTDIFGCTRKQEIIFAVRFFFTYCKTWKPRKYARAVLRKLRQDGHELYQITARKFASGHGLLGLYSRCVYKKWLRENRFNFDGIFFCSDRKGAPDKLKGIKRFSADIMIDDRPDISLYLAENGVKVLLFDTSYNKDVSHRNITRVYDWKDVYRKISGFAEK
ncbi:MAG: hypothetical protein K2G36_01345 [Ruminococcus sp.]|nr:hypothetical protein [Ruminococcus sp.]